MTLFLTGPAVRACQHGGDVSVDGGVPASLATLQVRRRRVPPHPRPVDLILPPRLPPARAPPMSPLRPKTPHAAPHTGPAPQCWLSSRNALLLLNIGKTVLATIVIVLELRVLPPAQCVNRGSRWAGGLHDTPPPQWQGLHCAGCQCLVAIHLPPPGTQRHTC